MGMVFTANLQVEGCAGLHRQDGRADGQTRGRAEQLYGESAAHDVAIRDEPDRLASPDRGGERLGGIADGHDRHLERLTDMLEIGAREGRGHGFHRPRQGRGPDTRAIDGREVDGPEVHGHVHDAHLARGPRRQGFAARGRVGRHEPTAQLLGAVARRHG